MEIQRIESKIQNTSWNLNTLDQKKALKKELVLLNRLYDKIVEYEGLLMGFPCAGATINPEGGPPVSTELSDGIGAIAQGQIAAGAAGVAGGGAAGVGGLEGGVAGGRAGGGFAFARHITDVEVRLLAGIVYAEHRLKTDQWHWNNLTEKKDLQRKLKEMKAALRRVRNGRC